MSCVLGSKDNENWLLDLEHFWRWHQGDLLILEIEWGKSWKTGVSVLSNVNGSWLCKWVQISHEKLGEFVFGEQSTYNIFCSLPWHVRARNSVGSLKYIVRFCFLIETLTSHPASLLGSFCHSHSYPTSPSNSTLMELLLSCCCHLWWKPRLTPSRTSDTVTPETWAALLIPCWLQSLCISSWHLEPDQPRVVMILHMLSAKNSWHPQRLQWLGPSYSPSSPAPAPFPLPTLDPGKAGLSFLFFF